MQHDPWLVLGWGEEGGIRSPCWASIKAAEHGYEHVLLLMTSYGFHNSVKAALTDEPLFRPHRVDDRCLADFYAGYGLWDLLVPLLEKSEAACDYVMNVLDPSTAPHIDTDGEELTMPALIIKAQHYARVAMAARAARMALEEL